MTHFCLPSKNAQGFKIEYSQNNKPKTSEHFVTFYGIYKKMH